MSTHRMSSAGAASAPKGGRAAQGQLLERDVPTGQSQSVAVLRWECTERGGIGLWNCKVAPGSHLPLLCAFSVTQKRSIFGDLK